MNSFFAFFFAIFVNMTAAMVVSPGYELTRRQLPNVPACASQCGDALQSSAACGPANPGNSDAITACQCSDAIGAKWGACFSCSIQNGAPQETVRGGLGVLQSNCQRGGHPIQIPPTLSASGSPSGSPAPSAGSPSTPVPSVGSPASPTSSVGSPISPAPSAVSPDSPPPSAGVPGIGSSSASPSTPTSAAIQVSSGLSALAVVVISGVTGIFVTV